MFVGQCVACLPFCGSNMQLKNGIVTPSQAGENHSAALTSFGEVYSWGRGEFGVLGHGDARSRKTPAAIAALKSASTCVCDLVSGSDHMFGIT